MTYSLCIVAHNILVRKALLVEQLAIHHYAGPSNLSLLEKKKECFGLGEQSCLNFENANAFLCITMWKSIRGMSHFLWCECHGSKSSQMPEKEGQKNWDNCSLSPPYDIGWYEVTERSPIKLGKSHGENVRKCMPSL